MSDKTQEARKYLMEIPEFRFYTHYIERNSNGLAGDFAYDLVEYLKSLPKPEYSEAEQTQSIATIKAELIEKVRLLKIVSIKNEKDFGYAVGINKAIEVLSK